MHDETVIRIEIPALDRLVTFLHSAHPNQVGEILTKLTGIETSLQEIKVTQKEIDDLESKHTPSEEVFVGFGFSRWSVILPPRKAKGWAFEAPHPLKLSQTL